MCSVSWSFESVIGPLTISKSACEHFVHIKLISSLFGSRTNVFSDETQFSWNQVWQTSQEHQLSSRFRSARRPFLPSKLWQMQVERAEVCFWWHGLQVNCSVGDAPTQVAWNGCWQRSHWMSPYCVSWSKVALQTQNFWPVSDSGDGATVRWRVGERVLSGW